MNHHIIPKPGLLFFIFFLQSLFGIDYNTHIQPIFNENCTSCHGSSGGLNLTNYDNLMDGGNSGPVIISGYHQQSLLWTNINSGAMPPDPESSNPDLTDAMVELIGNWIDADAGIPASGCDLPDSNWEGSMCPWNC